MIRYFLVLSIFIVSNNAFSNECPSPGELNDVLECLKEKHQLVLLKNLDVQNSKDLEKFLGQRPNPKLNIQSVHSSHSSQTQVTVMQELDLGGQLNALKGKGRLVHDVRKNELAVTREEVIQEVLLNIHHLTHINETLNVNHEILASLLKVTGALKKRRALTPEQEASLSNFNLQMGEVRNLIALLEDEQEEVLLFFLINGGYSKESMLKVMEDHGHSLHIKEKEGLSLSLERLGLETKIAEKDLKLAKASVFENISIGPMFIKDEVDEVSEELFGVSVNIPLPLWHQNQAGKALAQRALRSARERFSFEKEKEDLQKVSLQKRIDKLQESLSELPDKKVLKKTHARMEKLYSQGLVSPSSFLDSHRVWRDVTSSRLELEEKILLLNILYYRLIGKLGEVHL